MSEKLYKVKPLAWADFQYGSEVETPFGRYGVELPFPGFKRRPYWLDLDDNRKECASLEAGKLACEAHWRERLAKVLEEVPSVDRLMDAAEQFIEVASLGPATMAYDTARWELHDAIKAASEVMPSGWQPIETAPKDGTAILAVCKLRKRFVCWWTDSGRFTQTGDPGWVNDCSDRDGENHTYEPTHWQPLPEVPR